jgi:hypothetical protein
MAKRDTELLQVLIRQIGQDADVYGVLAESGLVLFKAKAPQPTSKVHDGALGLRRSISSGEVLGAVVVRRGRMC